MPITVDDFIVFCERTIDGMARAVSRLDDELVTCAPALRGANSPYRLVTHALAACAWWTGHVVCGHASDRDRAAEFTAEGSVANLLDATRGAKAQLRQLQPEMEAATALRFEPATETPLNGEWTVGAALIHAYEELAQHLGHLEITVDLLLDGRADQ